MSYIHSVPPPSDSDDGILSFSEISDRSNLDSSWGRHLAHNARISGWRGKALMVSVCRLFLALIALGCGFSGTAHAQSQLTASSNYLTFGSVNVGSSATLPVTLTSSGTSPLTISSASIGGTGYSVSGASFPLTLNPQQSVTLQFKFAPPSANRLTGTMVLNSNSSTASAIAINMTGNGVMPTTGSLLTISSNYLTFGSVNVGSSATLPVTLTSSGTSPLTISSASIGGTGYSVSGANFPLTLNPQQSVTLQFTFAPPSTSTLTGTMVLNSNSSTASAVAINMSGKGKKPTTGSLLTISSNYLTFGNVNVGSSATLPVTLTSTGTTAVTISSASIGGSGYSVSGASFPLTLNPQQSATLQFKFAPPSASTLTGTMVLNSNSAMASAVAINMSGTGVTAGTPQLTVSPILLPFGNVAIGSSATLPVTLTSSGTSAVTVNSVAIGGTGFTVTGATFPLTMSPKQSVALQVTYSPTAANAATGSLTISSNSSTSGTATVSMTGTGTVGPQLTVSPSSLSFGDVNVGSTATLGATLTSSGGSAVTVNSATISGSGFTVSGATFPVTLSPQQSVSLQVAYAPTAASSSTGALTINSNSSTNGTVAVSLSGTGAQHQVSLSWQAPSSSSDPVAGYHVYRASGTSSSYSLLTSSVDTKTSYVDSGVQGSTSYSYYVTSVDASGNESAASNAVSVSVP